MTFVVLVVLFSLFPSVPALIGGTNAPFVKFRYHGTPRVKCMNCKIKGENLAPELIGDGVACTPMDNQVWDCEVPDPISRFWVSQNHTELIVVIRRDRIISETKETWSFYVPAFVGTVVFAVGKFVIAFMRGPVSGHLTSWFLRKREKLE